MWKVETVSRANLENFLNTQEENGWRILTVSEGEKWLIGGSPIPENKLWNIVMSKPEIKRKAKAAGATEGEPD